MAPPDPAALLDEALAARAAFVAAPYDAAFRLFHGFSEGDPSLAVDVYGRTLVLHDHAAAPDAARALAIVAHLASRLPWLRAAVWKARHDPDPAARNGRLLLGEVGDVDRKVREHGVWYALDLTMQRDASLYLDTRNLRSWAKRNLAGASVLNAFAYTGSLGVAALAAPARSVLQLDRSRAFLAVAERSCAFNRFPMRRGDLRVGDYFSVTAGLRREGRLFDCVFVDPPFFSATRAGTVDLVSDALRVLDKARPLVAHDGRLVAVNNALYLPGAAWMRTLEGMCEGGWAEVEAVIPAPEDFTVTREGAAPAWPEDPAPFNHPTKIAVLRVRRKDGRRDSLRAP